MASLTDFTGLAGVAILALSVTMWIPVTASGLILGHPDSAKYRLALLQATVFVLLLIPMSEMPLAAYLRGITGDVSITTLVVIYAALLDKWYGRRSWESVRKSNILLIWLIPFVLILYPMSLGLTDMDPYRLGYGNPYFVIFLILYAAIAWHLNSKLIAICTLSAVMAWSAGWYESNNLWDYLIDPWISTYIILRNLFFWIGKLLKFGKIRHS